MTLLQSGITKSLAVAYDIDNSLRFNDGDSPNLYRSPTSAGNRKTFTISVWAKKSGLGTNQVIIGAGESPGSNNEDKLGFASQGTLEYMLKQDNVEKCGLQTTRVFRDVGAWYHIVLKYDSTPATPSSSSIALYINGEQVTELVTETYPVQDIESSFSASGWLNYVGKRAKGDYNYFNSYLAELYFIDGTALTPSSFAETNATTNQWIPLDSDDVKAAVTFGTNGFYQKYAADGGHTSFLADGTYTTPAGVTSVDYLVVGGGGGGGTAGGGGGGAGAYRTGTLTVTGSTDYSITVGGGGTGGVFGAGSPSGVGTAGGDSIFLSITSAGGGQGGAPGNRTGYDGGSGGGGNDGYPGGTGGSYGNNGGSAGSNIGGGGGGASVAGQNVSGTVGGNGGAGTASSITGASVTYAGGGGGSQQGDTGGGAGGAGGGGAGSPTVLVDGSPGTANTGGGGGGGGYSDGGNGGSGIVIIKPAAGFGLGLDSSGEGNNFTATNLVATDQMVDTPTNNFATMNPLDQWQAPTFSEGNLKISSVTGGEYEQTKGTIGQVSGKYYFETRMGGTGASGTHTFIGVMTGPAPITSWFGGDAGHWSYGSEGKIVHGGTTTDTTPASYTDGDIIGCAVDLDNGELYWSKDNTWITHSGGTCNPVTRANPCYSDLSGTILPAFAVYESSTNLILNAGSDSSFSGTETAQGNQDGNNVGDFYYTPPSGFVALCASNLPSPEIALPGDYFNTVIYTGTGSELAVTGVGFQPDFTWFKTRELTYNHRVFDVVRGVGEEIHTNDTDVQSASAQTLKTFDSDGFTLGTSVNVNPSSSNMVSWNWKETPTAGFDIVSYTGTGVVRTVSHNLGVVPIMMIVKDLTSTENWQVYTESMGNAKTLNLNTTAAEAAATHWDSTSPTISVFTVGTSDPVNKLDDSYIAYLFASVEGYSKIGSYTGNGATGTAGSRDGPFIYTGFNPAFTLIKHVNSTGNWFMYDNTRDTYNYIRKEVMADRRQCLCGLSFKWI